MGCTRPPPPPLPPRTHTRAHAAHPLLIIWLTKPWGNTWYRVTDWLTWHLVQLQIDWHDTWYSYRLIDMTLGTVTDWLTWHLVQLQIDSDDTWYSYTFIDITLDTCTVTRSSTDTWYSYICSFINESRMKNWNSRWRHLQKTLNLLRWWERQRSTSRGIWNWIRIIKRISYTGYRSNGVGAPGYDWQNGERIKL